MPIALLAQSRVSESLLAQLIASVVLIAIAVLLRFVLRRGIQNHDIASQELRRRWLLQVRNLTFLLIAAGLILIWSTELKTAAISVVAFVVAMVLATKELILCLSGGFLKVSSKSFSLGDHIEVGTVRGEVIDQTLLTTKLMEISSRPNGQQFTGRMITLPNAVLLNQPVINESLTKTFGLHVFTIPVKAEADWAAHEQALQSALEGVCKAYLDDARRAVASLSHEEGLSAPNVEPRVQLSIPEPGRVDLVARLPYPVARKGRVLQEVMRAYLHQAASIQEPEQDKLATEEPAEHED